MLHVQEDLPNDAETGVFSAGFLALYTLLPYDSPSASLSFFTRTFASAVVPAVWAEGAFGTEYERVSDIVMKVKEATAALGGGAHQRSSRRASVISPHSAAPGAPSPPVFVAAAGGDSRPMKRYSPS